MVPAFLRREAPRNLVLPRPSTPPPRRAAPEPVAATGSGFDPSSLPMPTLSRRRLATIAGGLVAAWLLNAFSRQVGDASAASNRAAELRTTNASLRSELTALQADLRRVQAPEFVNLEARAYGLGAKHEIPFALAADAPALAANAPGSAAVRLGAPALPSSPLEAWLDLLFGPGR